MRNELAWFAAFLLLACPVVASAADDIAFLREDCGTLTPCFTTTAALETWLWGTRNPSASDPVAVDVGPGTFGAITCTNEGHVTFRGAGRDHSVIESTGSTPAVSLAGCTDIAFQDLKVKANAIGFYWTGAGTLNLTDLDVEVGGSSLRAYGWWDENCNGAAEAYWWGVRVAVEATMAGPSLNETNTALYNQCVQHWIYGSELTVAGSAATPAVSRILTVYVLGGDTRLFGSVVRAQSAGATTTTWESAPSWIAGTDILPGFTAVWVGTNSQFHMHGGIVNADASTGTGSNDAYALYGWAQSGPGTSFSHTPDTAFVVKASGSGTATRVASLDAVVQSPFLWPAGAAPPPIESQRGSDQFVETDCASDGDCATAGSETHLMIYNDTCSVDGPWFNAVTGACRGTIVP